jgi:hypothetical protein
MGYLTRRVEHLLKLRDEGKFLIASSSPDAEAGRKLLSELDLIDRYPNGSIVVATCSPMVRAVAKAAFAMEHYELIEDTISSSPEDDAAGPAEASRAMTEYFQLLEEFFITATGHTAETFDFDEYRGKVISGDPSISATAKRAYDEYPPKIAKFHSHNSSLLYRSARSLGGLKVVLGGSSRFPKAALDGVRKMVLYADTILVPDPLLPWLEVNRVEERFSLIEFLRNARQLLLLKPLVDAKLTSPAVLVFPSWEKSFELKDIEAKDGISHLILGFFSAYLNTTFEDESELVEYVQGPGQAKFEETVTAKGLFWPPEETGPLPFAKGVVKYQAWLGKWRSEEWLETMSSLPPHLLILNGILERLTPHYHAWDNANAVRAQPMYWLSPHFHYYRLISSAGNLMVHQSDLISNPTFSSLESLLNPKAAWLGNVPIRDLARLREENANEQFRARLHSYMDDLASAELQDLDSVSASVMRALESLLAEHDREAKRLADSLERKLTHTLAGSILTIAAAMYPWLESWLGLALLVPPIKAAYHLIEDTRERKALSRSLVGVLSEAHSGTDNQQTA